MVKYCTDNGLPLPSVKRKPKEPTITFQEKKELSQVVKGLSTNELAHITIIVQQNCPEAYVQLEKQKVMILLEKLNYPTYNKIKEYSQAANH